MYMIIEKKYKFSDAYRIVKEKRKCAEPNSGFRRKLEQKSYDLYNEIQVNKLSIIITIINFKEN